MSHQLLKFIQPYLVGGILGQVFAEVLQLVHPVRHEVAVEEDDPGRSLAAFLDQLSSFLLLAAAERQDAQLLPGEAHLLGEPVWPVKSRGQNYRSREFTAEARRAYVKALDLGWMSLVSSH